MKWLRSPWVTGVLVVVAIVVVGYQVVMPQWRRSHPAKGRPAPPAAAPVSASAPTPPAPATVRVPAAAGTNVPAPALTGAAIDRAYVQAHLAEWIDAPRRDPFLLASADAEPAAASEEPSPVPGWKLKGIWRQTGSRLAAINQGVYQEGDQIQGYKIERIESDQVWFRGSNRLESLSFASRNPAALSARTNAPSRSAPNSAKSTREQPLIQRLLLLEPRGKGSSK